MFFEVVGQIQNIETLLMALQFARLGGLGGNTGSPIGENAKALRRCSYRTEQYALPKFIGMKPRVLASVNLKLNAIWINDYVKSLFCCLCQ